MYSITRQKTTRNALYNKQLIALEYISYIVRLNKQLTKMTYYSVLDVTPTNDSWIPDYLGAVGKIVAKHGGKYLARTATHEQIEGQGDPVGLRVILEWPSKEAAYNFMGDPDYANHFIARTNGSVSNHYLIEGNDQFT